MAQVVFSPFSSSTEVGMEFPNWMYGLVGELGLWQYGVLVLLLTQPTIMAVTLYLHREQAHGAIRLHPVVAHFFRFWLWLTTGMKTDEWVSVHRKHHKRCETPEDPHSPVQKGFWHILFFGVHYYRVAAAKKSTREYILGAAGAMLPNDWLERNVYQKRNWLGLKILLAIHLLFLGIPGAAIWLTQYLWIPIHAAGIINGVGHAIGYRNADTRNGDGDGPDASTNIVPWGLWIGGEELHNNHHLYPTSAKFSQRWFEVDIGWGVIRLLEFVHLVEVRHVSFLPSVSRDTALESLDDARKQEELLRIFQHHKWFIARLFRKALERERMLSSRLKEEFDAFLVARGSSSVTKDEFARWLREVAHSGRKQLVAFAEKVLSFQERFSGNR